MTNQPQKILTKSSIVPQEEIITYQVPYQFQDTCVREYVKYHKCMRQNPRIIENGIVHKLPISRFISNCQSLKEIFSKCQDYREREIFEEMRQIYVQSTREGQIIERSANQEE